MSDLLGMHRAVMRSTRSITEKMVLLAIIDHWSEASPEPWPSVPTLSKLCSSGRTAVLGALAGLERDGVIAVRRVAGGRTGMTCRGLSRRSRRRRNQSARRTGLGLEPVRLADDTSPFGGRDQSAWRTRRIPRRNQPRKPLPCARARPMSQSAPSSCLRTRAKRTGCDRTNGRRRGESRRRMGERQGIRARCQKCSGIRGCAPCWCCLRPGIRWLTSNGSQPMCRRRRGGAAGSAFEGLAAFRSRLLRERWLSGRRPGVWSLQRAWVHRTAKTVGFIGTRCSKTRRLVDMGLKSHARR
jgi:hypothetical protein